MEDIKINQPAIKWTGSKRSQANTIVSYMPKKIDTYYEPFCGGCSVLIALIQSNVKVKHYECSDLNSDLINLWNFIKNNHLELIEEYKTMWHELNKDEDMERRNYYYYEVRDRLNKFHNPIDFNFIMRNSVNGMARYNSRGEFNSPFHFTRKGISPDNFRKVIEKWNRLLNEADVRFSCKDYRDVIPSEKDFVYIDPPYANTKCLYFGGINLENLWKWIGSITCKYAFSFDGSIGNKDFSYEVPKLLYDRHIYIESGKSSFRRIVNSVIDNKDNKVYESLYLN